MHHHIPIHFRTALFALIAIRFRMTVVFALP
jgi:hypothetical protein